MRGEAFRSAGSGPVAGDEDDAAVAAMVQDGPARLEELSRVEWVASPGRSGRSRLGGSVHNDYGRTTLSVQLRISEIDAAGETVATVTGPTLERVGGRPDPFRRSGARQPRLVPRGGGVVLVDFARPAPR